MRHQPRPFTALIVFAIYLALFYGTWIAFSVDYERIGDDAGTLARWYVAPTWVGGLFLIGAVTWLGWWRPVLFEKARARSWWYAVAPAFMVIALVVMAVVAGFSELTAAMLILLALGSIGVGFAEEVATRGVLLTGFRARLTEPWVWFLTCLLFGLLHLPNWFFGVGPGAAGQVVLAFGSGSVFYLLRRVSGNLLWPMLLHGAWDFVNFAGEIPGGFGAVAILNSALGIVLGAVLIRRERGRRTEQVGVPATATN